MDSLVTRFLCLYGMINSPLCMLIMVFLTHKNVLYNFSLRFLAVVRRLRTSRPDALYTLSGRFGQVVQRLRTLCPDAPDR